MFPFLSRMAAGALLFAMASFCGCASLLPPPPAGIVNHPAAHSGVTIIFVESPRELVSICGLAAVSDYFNAHGINSLYYDPLLDRFDAQGLADLIRYVKRDPTQRVMVVGWSLGGAMSVEAIDILAAQGICVETCVVLDWFRLYVKRGPYARPPNVARFVVVRNQAFTFSPRPANVETHIIGTLNHCAMPTHPQTIQLLFAEAALLSQMQVAN